MKSKFIIDEWDLPHHRFGFVDDTGGKHMGQKSHLTALTVFLQQPKILVGGGNMIAACCVFAIRNGCAAVEGSVVVRRVSGAHPNGGFRDSSGSTPQA